MSDRITVTKALAAFQSRPLKEAARQLLDSLGYRSDRSLAGSASTAKAFLELFSDASTERVFDQDKALVSDWKTADLLFQLTDQELSRESSLFTDTSVKAGLLKSYVFIAIELKGSDYARGKFSAIARQINRIFPMPVMVFFKHQDLLTIAVINRRMNKLDESKDVLGKVTLIREIKFTQPHTGHLDILASLALSNLVHPQKKPITDFDTLHAAWEQIFNIELLNERFYRELANWYFWALPQVDFPADLEKDDEKRRATGLIRLLTRLIFCWFLKEKSLIPEKLFHPTDIKNILVDFGDDSSSYYQAILQNLFFATLNQRMGKDSKGNPYRFFAKDEGFQKNRTTYDINNLYRYESLFREPTIALSQFEDIPFLNGGLFECLDRTEEATEKKRYLDGFSRNVKKRPTVPNRLFFGNEKTINLADTYGDTRRKAEKVSGLIHILNRYKFTIVENTPIDQEIALDPELLGKVFENLLASYNEETKTTARKQTGSFYTPRPIVEYMVDESLKAYLTRALVEKAGMKESDACAGLELLFAYTEKAHAFSLSEVACLIAAIDALKILDPACGSGAFPMGVLHKLVYILGKLDHDNERWKQTQLAKLDSAPMREELESAFQDNNDDYGRKLYLIENCLYGVDIQPIAIQITKLRFFISLVCDQKTNRNKKENHGIRPLPNLETKFVAADTLMGLPKMEQTLLVDPRVGIIEKEIEALYHSHFSEQRRDKKLVNQRRVKSLRQELGKLLAESLMAPKKAQHIADWDPFDPQSSADFFDPHWMFGRSLASGFDVVIGNPPWGATLTKEQKERLKTDYPEIDSSTPNSFAYFIGAALRQSHLSIAFVLPDSILIKDYARTRQLIAPKLTDIAWYLNTGVPESCRQFVYVEHDVCVLILNQVKNSVSCHIRKQFYDSTEQASRTESYEEPKKNFIFKEHDFCFNLLIRAKERSILEKLAGHVSLGSITQCHEGIHTGNSRDLLFHDRPINKFCKPLFYGGRAGDHIANYYSERSNWYVDYRASIIDKDQGYYASLRDERIFALPKIYITRTGNPIMAFYDSDNYASNNFFSLQLLDYSQNSEANLKAILPLILSSLANYYIRTFAAPRLGDTYIETKIIHLDRIPVSADLLRQSSLFLPLTNLMILAVKEKLQSQNQFLSDLIDACVLECYFREHMAERELLFHDIVAKHLASYDAAASEAHQTKFLTGLHSALNAPSHPIRNRLLRLTADSPDLLAIIKTEGRV
jgi:type I restriction-modification system DNA methylase subunit